MGLRRHFAALVILFLTLNGYLTDACRGGGGRRGPPCNTNPRTVRCPSSIVKLADPRSTSAVVSWNEPQATTTSQCGHVDVKRTDNTGLTNGGRFFASESPYYITYTASDRHGHTNHGFCRFHVTVKVLRCGMHPPVPNGFISCTHGDQYGSDCTINCISGYSRSGSPRRTCQRDGRWSGTMPRCIPIRCSPELTKVKYSCTNGNYYGSICTRSCNPGYAIAPGHSSSRVCQADGQWTGTHATCEDIRAPTLDCPDTIRHYADPSTTTQTVTWEPPRVQDNSKLSILPVQTMGQSSGSSFGRGSHNIRYEATDKAGNTGSCSFSVIIQVIQCPSLAVLPGQTKTCSSWFNYGSVCQIQCFPGYALSSGVLSISIECQSQGDSTIGTWSAAQPTCDEVTCPALTPPTNGQFDGGTPCSTAYGTWCRFECNEGFQLTGYDLRRCLVSPGASQGSWDGPVARCEVQTCPRAYVPTYGHITNSDECPASDLVPAQTTCSYNCQQGHVLTGAMDVTCGSDGDWIQPFPYCGAVTCDSSELPAPANGLKNGCPRAEEIFGTTCILLCNRGYMPTQPTYVTCTDNGNGVGVWDGNTITCEEVKCDPLDVPTGPGYTAVTCTLNGAPRDPAQMQSYNAVCVSSCNPGFTASGSGSHVCLQTGQWDGTPLHCNDITPPTLMCPPDITLFAGQGTSFAVIDYTWEPIEALDASGNSIASLISINGQPVPANRSTVFHEGTYRLDYSATDNGGNSAMCDILVNVIVARCPPLYGPQNSETSLVLGQGSCDMSAVFGSVCSVTCEDGYTLSTGSDSVNAECIRVSSLSTTGTWQLPSVDCEPNTCRVPPIVNGYISGCVGLDVDYQSSCSFICNTGHRSNQTSLSRTIRTCRADETWTGQDTFCEPVVCTGMLSLNQGTIQPPECSTATELPYGRRCTFTCNDGFALNGPFSRVCTAEGVWNDVRPVSCTDHQPPVFTESCPMYHTRIAVPNMRQAVVLFPTPQATDNSNSVSITSRDPNLASGSSFLEGTTRLIYTATDSAMNSRRCDVYITVQVLRCRPLQAPASGSLVDCASNILGSTCRFACNTGYNLMGPSYRTCQRVVNSNGFGNTQAEWTGVTPSCSPVTCPALNDRPHPAIRSGCAHYPPATELLGTTCSWYCPYGYGGTGAPRSVCLASGTWDAVDFTCEERRCPALVPTTGMEISPTNCLTAPTYNDLCFLRCSRSGYRVNPPSYDFIRCLGSGDWTRNSTAFTCVDYEEPHFTSCPLGFTEYTIPGTTDATVTWVVAAGDNSGETPLISCSIQQPAVLAVGEHSVICTATDGADNHASCNFQVQVKVRRCRSLNPPIYGTFVGSCDNCQDCTCQVSCVNGYTLQGASTATCTRNNSTGMMYWARNGQHPTCQITRCEPLPGGLVPSNGGVYPSFCRGPMYPYFGTTCHFFCQTGYGLTGPVDHHVLTCLPDGTWNQNLFTLDVRCQDNVPPTIQPCPMSLSGSMSGHTLGVILSFDVPMATDNSGADLTVFKTPPDIDSPYNFTRNTDVSYVFVDPSGNRAYCNISVYIEDNLSPVLVSCPSDITETTLLTDTPVSWQMPEFIELTGDELDISCTVENGSKFRWGSTNVQCHATNLDNGKTTMCHFTVTLTPIPCTEPNAPRNGAKACEAWAYGRFCYMSCNEKHDITINDQFRSFLACSNEGRWLPPPGKFPDCTARKRPGKMGVLSALHYFSGDCNSPATQQQIKENFLQALNMSMRFRQICIEAGSRCNVSNVVVTCGSSTRRKRSSVIDKWTDSQQDLVPWSDDSTDGIRVDELTKRAQKWLTEMRANGKLPPDAKDEYLRRRRLHSHQSLDPARERSHGRRKRDAEPRVTVSFTVILEMPDTLAMTNDEYENAAWDCYDELDRVTAVVQDMANHGNLTLDVDGLQMQSDMFEPGYPDVVCSDGYEATYSMTCVGCAPGLYFDTVSKTCEECPIGHYQDEEAQLECKACPAGTSTLQLGSQCIADCRGLCAIGQYSNTGLEPCSNCETRTYQMLEGALSCDPCPYGQSTAGIGASSVTACIDVCPAGSFSAAGVQPCNPCPLHSYQPEEGQCSCYPCPAGQITQSIGSTDSSMCQTQTFCSATSCLNDGTCVEQLESYHCNCPLGLTGSRCETDVVDCQPESCLNGATCVEERNGFSCVCTTGFEGDDCSISIDYCVNDPCENGGTCRCQAGGFSCECDTGFAGLTCTDDINECIHNPCQNGASCLNLEGDYQCVCIPGFTGDNCETHIDECQSNPCRHNGTCVDGDNSYRCICISGFSGDNCEVDDDLCASNPCSHGATCQDLDDHYQCACFHGWGGVHCEIAMGPCNYQPCKNDGICAESTSEESGYVCACWPGFDGPDCEINIDECASEPCSNGGTCVDGVNNFECICADSCAGLLCEGRTDLCNPNPCQHDAPCEDEGADYYCACPAGLSGRHCETQVDVCREGETCQNGGVCAAPSMDQFCTCTDGFTGEHCEVNIDDCASQPCVNDALCIDDINSFTCVCLEGFTSALCDVELNECDAFPCHNGGSCVDKINRYECECANGFEGPDCENNKDDCFPGACVKGNCIDEVNSHRCQCDVGYTGRRCDININECQSNPCANGGACRDLVNGFVCDCADGWSGIQCDINIDDCASDPCLNSGQCIDGHLSYTCRCSAGFVGTFCEVDMNECDNNPCGNHGTCVDGVNRYTCSCSTGWKGDRCQINTGYCQPNPCKHGGSCTQTPQGFECQCPSGFIGVWCQTNIDDCVGNQCLNGATCIDQANRYSCRCPSGYTGRFCQTALDICTAEPCENGGVCLPSGNRIHHCTCLPGFTGVRCEVAIDNCQPNPCLHCGTCESNLNGYQCSCISGFTGTECELNINECLSQPCRNGAECMDGINEYQCKCKPGFIGLQCGQAVSTNFDFEFHGGQRNQFVALHGAVENSMQAFTLSFWIRTATADGHILSYSTQPNGWTLQNAEFALSKPSALDIFIKGFQFSTFINVNDSHWHHVAITWTKHGGRLEIYRDGHLQLVQYNVNAGVVIGGGGLLRLGHLYSPSQLQAASNRLTGALSRINLWDTVLHGSTIRELAETCSSTSPGNVVAAADFLNTAALGQTRIQTPSECDTVDDCASDPCAAGSTCVDGVGQYRCQCPPGFSGQWCQINIDDCGTGSTPCDNGGTCVDGVDSFTCQCPEGFSGQACELRRVDGGWSDWSEWDDCSQSCESGTQSRRRSCTNPRPAYGGSQCGGQPIESRLCNTRPCPYCRPIEDPENGYLDCGTEGTEYVCNISCYSGYAFSRAILPYYSCGPESNFRWSHEEDSSAAYIFPKCTAYKPPTKVAMEMNLAYGSDLTCDGINATHDRQVYQKVTNMAASNLQTVKCVQDNSCQKKYQVKGCSPQSSGDRTPRRRRRRSVESIQVTITLEHDVHIQNHPNLTNEEVTNQATTMQAAAELREGAMHLINQSTEGYFAVQIRNTMYDIDPDKTENFGVPICSPGTVRPEDATEDARCVPCEPGWYDSQDICQPCPRGMYQPQEGSTFCLACPRGMTTLRIGTIQESDCNRRDSAAAK